LGNEGISAPSGLCHSEVHAENAEEDAENAERSLFCAESALAGRFASGSRPLRNGAAHFAACIASYFD